MFVLKVRSRSREELVEFTDQVRDKLKESGQREGVVVLYVQHTTAGLTINTAWASATAKRIPTPTSKRA
jgi:thiamine phosphate synthase YjbQ (UPF0047 family)